MQKQGAGGIGWCDFTSNPIRPEGGGWQCQKVSEGCRHCYAEAMNLRFGNKRPFDGRDDRRWWLNEKELQALSKVPDGSRVFLADMTDLFYPSIPDAFRDVLLAMAVCRPHVDFQILTKRPLAMREYLNAPLRAVAAHRMTDRLSQYLPVPARFEWPLQNLWAGTTAEEQRTFDARVPILLECEAGVHFVSGEPLLSALTVAGVGNALDWLIVGGESGPYARPFRVEWAESLTAECRRLGLPLYLKQLGDNPRNEAGDVPPYAGASHWAAQGKDWSQWPEALRVRAFPRARATA